MSVHNRPTPVVALSIAGTDSGGGAGLAADLHTFAAHGVFGTLVVSGVTAQNTRGVEAVSALSPEMVEAQLQAVLEDFALAAVKTGMLATPAIVEVVVAHARRGALPHLVVDPVMVAASGGTLIEGDARRAYHALVGFAEVVTPNIAEAEVLTGRTVDDRRGLATAATALVEMGARAALVTGGHLPGGEAIDVLARPGEVREFAAPHIHSANTHGTGCTLSAAIAARLALGEELEDAVSGAKAYVRRAIAAAAAWKLGGGPGPLDHGLGEKPLVPAARDLS